jgi:putative ABC transport system permease protein
MMSRYIVRPLAGALGWPLQKVSPVSGRLARDNSRRNPGRTAATASALMIGLGVVVFVAVFAQGLKSSFIDSFDKVVRADFVVQGKNFLPLPSDTTGKVQGVVGVQTAAGVQAQQAQVAGKTTPVYAVDPLAFRQVWKFDWLKGGNDALLNELGRDGVLIEEQTASTLRTGVGKTVTLTTVDGKQAKFKVVGMYRDPVMLNGLLMSDAAYQTVFGKPQLFMVLAKTGTAGGIGETQAALKSALASVATADVKTAQEYKDSIVKQVNQLLNLLYGLLAMSVIISLFGIVNTLVLSVFERTREIGLTRAIGMSRGQVRSTVRFESVITSIIGAIMGIVVGVVFAWVVTTRFAGQGITFSIPGAQLIVFLVVGVIVGVIAAILPARRAARIDILEAIHYE